jgi:CHAT domain
VEEEGNPTNLNYDDFEIEIGIGNGREYPVAVIHSASGEAREIMHFPFDDIALENQLLTLQNQLLRSGGHRRRVPSQEELVVQNFGKALFDALFTGEIRTRYAVSKSEARNQDKGLRLKLRILSPKLAALPWEYLYSPDQAEYICLSNNTPIVRYIELPNPPQPLKVASPLSILGMVCSPKNLDNLDIEKEKQQVEQSIQDLKAKGMVKLTWLDGHTWEDLQRALRTGPWHIFHFIGHGGFNPKDDEGLIAFEDSDCQAKYLTATQLGRLLSDHNHLRLVLLNSCEGAKGSQYDVFSSTATILIRRGIPAVLAMQYEITDQAAIELSRVFYEAIADTMPVDASVSEARKAITMKITNTIEWGTPVLYMRSPDGVLFNLIPKDNTQQEQTKNEKDQEPLKNTRPPSNPENIERTRILAYRQTITSMNDIFVKTSSRRLNSISLLESFEESIRDVMIGIRQTSESVLYEYIYSKHKVLQSLAEASDAINVAIDIISTGTPDANFYRNLRRCQTYLEEVLQEWENS